MTNNTNEISEEKYEQLTQLLEERRVYVEKHKLSANVTRTLADSIARNREYKQRMNEFSESISKLVGV